ncbi:RNA-directed DNA polymerase from mobile element jockey [Trichonephila clavipes]|nr:RNA-directed DNA polymerase from mobile element jockey [Trichonephila clavipes]
MPFISIFPPDLKALHDHPPPEEKQRSEVSFKSYTDQPHLLCCQALRKILLSWIQAFSDTHHLIPDFQHGFRKKISTCHQLLRTTNKIIDGFNNHRTTGGVFLDVEKAFDRVWHNGLIFKLIQMNLPPYLIKIIFEYLCNRTFRYN